MLDDGFRPRPRYRYFRALRISLVAGAAYDFAFAAVTVVAPELPERLLGLRPPGDAYFLWLIAVFLCMLGGFYLLAAYDPLAYGGNIVVAILGRAAGCLVMGWAAWRDPDLAGLGWLAAADGVFAVVHLAFLSSIRSQGP